MSKTKITRGDSESIEIKSKVIFGYMFLHN